MKQFEIQRVMNNNVILAKELKTSREIILMGKGIGFGKKKGGVSTSKDLIIEKSFVAGDETLKDSYMRMLEEVNGEIVEICTEILLVAQEKLGELSERSFIVIVDHISFAIEKLKKDIIIENPFSLEIEQLYPSEYTIGQYARKRIMEVLNVDVTEAEVGFIALHLHAAKENKGVTETLKNTRIIKSMLGIIEFELDISLADYRIFSTRLLLHLRGFIQQLQEDSLMIKHPLFDETVKQCSEAYSIALKLGKYVAMEKKKTISEEELFYLTIHVDRLMRETKSI